MRKAAWFTMAAMIAALASMAVQLYRTSIENSQTREQLARLEARQQQMQSPATQPAATTPVPEAGPPRPQPAATTLAPPANDAARQELIKLVDAKQRQLDAAGAAIQDLQHKMAQMDAEVSRLKEEGAAMQTAEKDLRERLDSASKLAEVLQAEMKSRDARLAQLQGSNKDLLRRSEDSARKLDRLMTLWEEVNDLNRRRDTYLTSILRRYREVSDFYRTLALRVDSPREGTTPVNADLSRLQNAITLADEDLRQLRSLNTQAERLQREIAASRKTN
jgi:chromosome segregation ATPase